MWNTINKGQILLQPPTIERTSIRPQALLVCKTKNAC